MQALGGSLSLSGPLLALQADSLPDEPQGKPKNTGMGSLSLIQWIFPIQELNRGLLHCRRILYQLSPLHETQWSPERGVPAPQYP